MKDPIVHQNSSKLPILKKDILMGLITFMMSITLYFANKRPEAWIIFFYYSSTWIFDWISGRSKKFEFYSDVIKIGGKQISYESILRVFKVEGMTILITKSKFLTTRYALYNANSEVLEVLKEKFHPKKMNQTIFKVIKISEILIYVTSLVGIIFFVIYLMDVKIPKWIFIPFILNAMLLLISTNLYFLLHSRFDEYIKLE